MTGEKSFNIQLLKYNIEFNKQEKLTIVPSDGKIIISYDSPRLLLLIVGLMRNWYFCTPHFLPAVLPFSTPIRIYTVQSAALFIIPTGAQKKSPKNNFNLMIPSPAYSAWRTIAIRNKLNVNRRHDGTFMKTTLNLFSRTGEWHWGESLVKYAFDLWKRLINFFIVAILMWKHKEPGGVGLFMPCGLFIVGI